MVASALKQASYGIVRTIRDLYGKQKLLLKLVVDFEAVVERVSSGISGSKGNTCKNNSSSGSSANVASTAATTDSGSSATTSPFQAPTIPTTSSGSTTSMHPSPRKLHTTTSTTTPTTTATTSKDNVPAPHLVTDSPQSDQVYHYRCVLTLYTLNTMYIYSIYTIYKVYYKLCIHFIHQLYTLSY